MYITNDKPNVSGLVLSGSADFKTELSQSDMFDPRLQAVVLGVVDVSYGARSTRPACMPCHDAMSAAFCVEGFRCCFLLASLLWL